MSEHEADGVPERRAEDLPEGVIDAEPAGGWESAETARSDAEVTGYEAEAVDAVETAEVTQGIDPDLATDQDARP